MNQTVIEVKGISKKYKISHEQGRYVTLRDVMANIIRKPFSFLKHKAKAAVGMAKKEEFWALKDVNFNVERGEVVGIIGQNGAGKSTLLKILSQITPPTEGEITIRGKVGSLLEVGTGFHPELTGRENVFLNGAILGMTKKDIVRKFDEIVAFAGIEKFLDTPVKYYSSGMYVRLAFSVAAHMDPDILLVDEVLAVGDAEFQKKCLGKMDEITKNQNRTILFVSHNMSAIQSLCKRSVLLEKGKVIAVGDTRSIVDRYLSSHLSHKSVIEYPEKAGPAHISKISLHDPKGSLRSEFPISQEFLTKVEFECREPLENVVLSIIIYSADRDALLYSSESDVSGKLSDYKAGKYTAEIKIPASLFNVGNYSFDIIFHVPNSKMLAEARDVQFEITNVDNPRSVVFQGHIVGKIAIPLQFEINKH